MQTLNILLNGQPATVVVSPAQIADLIRLVGAIPAIPQLTLQAPSVSPGEGVFISYSIAPCPGAVSFVMEYQDPSGEWTTSRTDQANPGHTIGSTLNFPEEQTTFTVRAIAIGSTGEQRESDPVTITI